jgi:hypothetical protein
LIISVAQCLAVLGAGLVLLLLAWRRPGWVVCGAISTAVLLDCFQIGAGGVEMGVNLYLDDAAGAALLLTGVLVLVRHRKGIPLDAVPCTVLLGLVALNFTRGISAFGLKPAGNGARNAFTFAVPALAIMLLGPIVSVEKGRLARWFGWAGCILCLIAALRWAGVLPMPVELRDDLRVVVRALPAEYAMVIGQAFIAVVYLQITGRRAGWWWAAAGMLGVVTVFLQHRSVWVATAAGLGWLAVRTARSFPVPWLCVAAAGVVGLGLFVVVDPTFATAVGELVSGNIQEAQSDRSTWAWRVQGFVEATDRVFADDTTDMLLGPPAGWAANSNASAASIYIHDRYVDTLAFYGVFGLAVLLLWLGVLARRASQGRQLGGSGGRGSPLLQALLLSELLYLVPYFGGILHGAALGLIWLAAGRTLSPRTGCLVLVRTVSPCERETAIGVSRRWERLPS